MENIIGIAMIYQIFLMSMFLYRYYVHLNEVDRFRKNYCKVVKTIVTTSLGIPFVITTLEYFTNQIPYEFNKYVKNIVNDLKKYDTVGSDTIINSEIKDIKKQLIEIRGQLNHSS